jgi:predicted nucleotidyltransferase
MTAWLPPLREEPRSEIRRIYPDRLRGLYLFGSFAREEARAESDLDVLIVLDAVRCYGEEVDRTGEVFSRLSLKYGLTISRVFASQADWQGAEDPFLSRVRPEAIPA